MTTPSLTCSNKLDSNQTPDTLAHDVKIRIDITENDIAEMNYHLNECPMSNMAANNAIVFALYRVVKPGRRISVSVRGKHAVAMIERREFALPKEVGLWLAKILMGMDVPPFAMTLRLPEVLVRSEIAAASKRKELAALLEREAA